VNRTKKKGINLLNAIRNHPDLKSILIFVITDSDENINKAAALNLNIAGYIPMSFESDKLNYSLSVLNDYWNIIEFSSQK
jgi:DNA-binding NarL/FixJ family response regulator